MNTKSEDYPVQHLVVKWNPSKYFHELAPDTIKIHCEILKKYEASHENYVWWGKASKSGRLGVTEQEIIAINKQIRGTRKTRNIYLYGPDTERPTLHVGKLEEIALDDKIDKSHTPLYYRDLDSEIPLWFKLSDIKKIRLGNISNLLYKEGEQFDPVGANAYPLIVHEKKQQMYFSNKNNYQIILEDYVMRCFKTGGTCSVDDIEVRKNRIFIGQPFSDDHQNLYDFAIKPVLEEMGFEPWKADEKFKNIDLMCKVCEGIQTSRSAIIDITDWNANVLFELGMIYGLSREALLLKEDNQDVPVDLKGLMYLPYKINRYKPLQRLMRNYLKNWQQSST